MQVSSKFGLLTNSTIFVYEKDSLIFASKIQQTGDILIDLEREKNYKLVVSNPGHVSVTALLSTEKMAMDQVKSLYFPIRLYNVRDLNIDYSNVVFKIKWNPYLERFETFQQNMGWIEEMLELEKKKEGK